MRLLILTVALLFTLAMGVLTALDIGRHGVTLPSVLATVVLVLFGVGIVGALLETPRR